MILLCLKEVTLKDSSWYLCQKCIKNEGFYMKVMGWHLWFLTWYMRKGSSLEDVDVPENGLRGYGHCWCMILFYPKDDTLKVLYWYLYWKCVRIVGLRRSDLGGHWGFLTRYLVIMVIPDALFYLILPQENLLKVLCWHLYWKCVKSDR